jgi:hypothetical protein
MEIAIERQQLVPAAGRDLTELSDNQIDADRKVLPMWMAGID